jgi:hypothetical protein
VTKGLSDWPIVLLMLFLCDDVQSKSYFHFQASSLDQRTIGARPMPGHAKCYAFL